MGMTEGIRVRMGSPGHPSVICPRLTLGRHSFRLLIAATQIKSPQSTPRLSFVWDLAIKASQAHCSKHQSHPVAEQRCNSILERFSWPCWESWPRPHSPCQSPITTRDPSSIRGRRPSILTRRGGVAVSTIDAVNTLSNLMQLKEN